MIDLTGDETGQHRVEVFEALADERRRTALSILSRTEGTMDRTELAMAVAERMEDVDATVTVEGVLRNLHHAHLPKLAEAGLVTYDVDEETVTCEGHPELDPGRLMADSADSSRKIPVADRDS